MPVVIVELWEGRTVEQKKELVQDITSVFTKRGISPQGVTVILKENPKHNWSRGGKLASE